MHYSLKFDFADMYGDSNDNLGYEPFPNTELEYDVENAYLISGEGIMDINGSASDNDIEMFLIAFCENKLQYFVPRDTEQKISKAIKNETLYYNILNHKRILIWDETTHSFKSNN